MLLSKNKNIVLVIIKTEVNVILKAKHTVKAACRYPSFLPQPNYTPTRVIMITNKYFVI